MKRESHSRRRPAGRVGIRGAFLTTCVLAAGCGGGSGGPSDGLAEAFLGHWEIESSTSSFTISCPNTLGSGAFPIWTELVLDHGVLSDLTDTSTACAAPGISFDVDSKGVVATAVNPDPYSGAAPLCQWVLGPDQNGFPIFINFSFSVLTITKLASSGTGMAPKILFAGNASGPLMQDDGTGTGTNVMTDTCTYGGSGDVFHRTTQP
jgi:hypothetical protein